jgi:hypothetical protein
MMGSALVSESRLTVAAAYDGRIPMSRRICLNAACMILHTVIAGVKRGG